jgi:hypothetical protein
MKIKVSYESRVLAYNKKMLRYKTTVTEHTADFSIKNTEFLRKINVFFGFDGSGNDASAYKAAGYNNTGKLPQVLSKDAITIFSKKIILEVIKTDNVSIKKLEVVEDSENKYKEVIEPDTTKDEIDESISPDKTDSYPITTERILLEGQDTIPTPIFDGGPSKEELDEMIDFTTHQVAP